ncbi:hypothetical protein C8F04DRAFT_329687 [Mycena alexandri]|uniref:F-box domain-containing protein n=1 Tax=Mycena alexandri TaxID=1745969 RepID=A0AAD6S2I0_9AGAR|nr:hypothetical protein C8F04DRAFT_329687 [Mycena alexandri]
MHPHSARMRARLAQIDEQLLLLQKEKTTLQHALAAAIYPVLTLPAQITSEIFAQCAEHPFHREPDPKRAPLLLTYVCRAWRDIAIHDPALWNRVRFMCEHNSYSSHRRLLAKLYLERAGTTPLDLHVQSTVEAGGRPRLLQDVIDRASQWRKVIFIASVPTLRDQFLGQLDLLILETLSLTRNRDSPGFFHGGAFAVAPKLQVVTLWDNYNPSSIMLPWSQLTKLTIHDCTWKSCIEVLGSAPNLVDLTFDPIIPPSNRFSDAVLAPHLHLKHLSVGGPELHAVLGRLNLPNLEQLEVRPGSTFDDSESRPGLLSFFRRSPKLSRFFCTLVESRRSFLLPLLVEMPNLSVLDLTASSCEVDAILRNLHQSPSFLPFIQNMSLAVLYDKDGSNHIAADVLSEAVFARWTSGSNAVERRGFRVVWNYGPNMYTGERDIPMKQLVLDDRLLELRRQGVDIHIGTADISWI